MKDRSRFATPHPSAKLIYRLWTRQSLLFSCFFSCLLPLSSNALLLRIITAFASLALSSLFYKKIITKPLIISLALCCIALCLIEIQYSSFSTYSLAPSTAFTLATSFSVIRELTRINRHTIILKFGFPIAYLVYISIRTLLLTTEPIAFDLSHFIALFLWFLVALSSQKQRVQSPNEQQQQQHQSHYQSQQLQHFDNPRSFTQQQNSHMLTSQHQPFNHTSPQQQSLFASQLHNNLTSAQSFFQCTPRILLKTPPQASKLGQQQQQQLLQSQQQQQQQPELMSSMLFSQMNRSQRMSSLISLESIVRESSIGVIIIDSDLQILFSNSSVLQFFECSHYDLKAHLFEWSFTSTQDSSTIKVNNNNSNHPQQVDDSNNNDDKQEEIEQELSKSDDNERQVRSSSQQEIKKWLTMRPRNADTITKIKKMHKSKSLGMRKSSQTISVDPSFSVADIFNQQLQNKTIDEMRASQRQIDIYDEDKSYIVLQQNQQHKQAESSTLLMLMNNSTPRNNHPLAPSVAQQLMPSTFRRGSAMSTSNSSRVDLTCNTELIEGLRDQSIKSFLELLTILLDSTKYKASQHRPYRSESIITDSKQQRTEDMYNAASNKERKRKKNTDTLMHDDNGGDGNADVQQSLFDYKVTRNMLSIVTSIHRNKESAVDITKKTKTKQSIFVRLEIKVIQRNTTGEIELIIEIIDSSIVPSHVIERKEFEHFKQRVLSSVSHELRTPLNCSMQLLDILSRSDFLSEPQKKMFITPALNSNHLLLCMINDVLDFSSILSGNLSLSFSSFDLLDTLRECIGYFQFQAACKSLAFELTFDNNIPAIVHTDPTRFKQVVINLLSNAVKFTSKGAITVSAESTGADLIRITVTDTGCGIPAHVGSNIFRGLEPQFFNNSNKDNLKSAAHTNHTQLNTKGAGLGLAIANTIAMGLSGNRKIEFESEVDSGSVFSFQLINRSKTSKGCYFRQKKVFSNTFSKWRTLIDHQSSSIESRSQKQQQFHQLQQQTSNLSIDQTSIIQLEKRPSKQAILFPSSVGIDMIRKKNTSLMHLKRATNSNLYVDADDNTRFIDDHRSSYSQSTLGGRLKSNSNNNNNNITPSSSMYQHAVNNMNNLEQITRQQQHVHEFGVEGKSITIRFQQSQLQAPFSVSEISSPTVRKASANNMNGIFSSKHPESSIVVMSPKNFRDDESCNIHVDSTTVFPFIHQSSFKPTCRKDSSNSKQQAPMPQQQSLHLQSPKQVQQSTKNENGCIVNNYKTNTIGSCKKIKDAEVEGLPHSRLISNQIQNGNSNSSQTNFPIHNNNNNTIYNNNSNSHSQFTSYQSFSTAALKSPIHNQLYNRQNQLPSESAQYHDYPLVYSNKPNKNSSETGTPSLSSSTPNIIANTQQQRFSLPTQIPLSLQPLYPQMQNKMQTISEEIGSHTSQQHLNIASTTTNPPPEVESFKSRIRRINTSLKCACPRILVVDDNEFNLYALQMRLTDYGFQVEKALSGVIALQIIKQRLNSCGATSIQSSSVSCDENNDLVITDSVTETEQSPPNQFSTCCSKHILIFMDIDMPIKNGHETTIDILKYFNEHSQIPPTIAACTAFVSNHERSLATAAGMSFYLTKPVNTPDLEAILKSVFDK